MMCLRWISFCVFVFLCMLSTTALSGDLNRIAKPNMARAYSQYAKMVAKASRRFEGIWDYRDALSKGPVLVKKGERAESGILGTVSITYKTNEIPLIVDIILNYNVSDGLSAEDEQKSHNMIEDIASSIIHDFGHVNLSLGVGGKAPVGCFYEISGSNIQSKVADSLDWRKNKQYAELREVLIDLWNIRYRSGRKTGSEYQKKVNRKK